MVVYTCKTLYSNVFTNWSCNNIRSPAAMVGPRRVCTRWLACLAQRVHPTGANTFQYVAQTHLERTLLEDQLIKQFTYNALDIFGRGMMSRACMCRCGGNAKHLAQQRLERTVLRWGHLEPNMVAHLAHMQTQSRTLDTLKKRETFVPENDSNHLANCEAHVWLNLSAPPTCRGQCQIHCFHVC